MATRSKKVISGAKERFKNFRNKRPHRTLKLSKQRDYVRPLELPGYIAFTSYVLGTIWRHKKHLIGLAAVSAVASVLLVGLGSQDAYQSLVEVLNQTTADVIEGGLGELEKAGLVLLSFVGVGGGQIGEVQQVYIVLISLFVWLTVVWLLRNLLANKTVKLRDALYSASAPLVAMAVLSLVLVIQLIPAAIAMVGYSAATISGLLEGGVEAMLFWVAAGGLILISLFWIVSTLFAMVIVTLPGTYPFKALSIAGDMVAGRRLKIVYRILWMMLVTVVAWLIVVIPVILFDGWLKSVWEWISWLPLVPIVVLAMTSVVSVWVSSYIYLLYRKIVDEDARHG